jgi:PST family polysaccharide transporter
MFYSEEFSDAVMVLRISSLSLIFLAMSQVYGINYMIISGYERALRNITLRWSIVGFVISFPLIYFFDYVGAVLTITLIRGLIGGNTMFTSLNIRNKQSLSQ